MLQITVDLACDFQNSSSPIFSKTTQKKNVLVRLGLVLKNPPPARPSHIMKACRNQIMRTKSYFFREGKHYDYNVIAKCSLVMQLFGHTGQQLLAVWIPEVRVVCCKSVEP